MEELEFDKNKIYAQIEEMIPYDRIVEGTEVSLIMGCGTGSALQDHEKAIMKPISSFIQIPGGIYRAYDIDVKGFIIPVYINPQMFWTDEHIFMLVN